MAYEDTKCPCGESKPASTMLCDECLKHFAATVELAAMNDIMRPIEARRGCAIKLLSMARRRMNRHLPLSISVG